MILMIDNYDSFTYNLVQYCGELGQAVDVRRNDAVSVTDIEALKPDYIIVSPGPCTPDDAGISMAVVRHFAGRIPLLGVCLGHQSMAQAFGGRIVHAREVMHGKTSPIHHTGQGIFADLDNPFTATRYHSLVAERHSLPECFAITAWTELEDGAVDEIMAIEHKTQSLYGVQFHPESILTACGHRLLANFIDAPARVP